MTVVALPQHGYTDSWSYRSTTPVRFSEQWKPILSAYYERFFIADSEELETIEAQLALLSKQAERAVRQRSRYYSEQLTGRLLESLSTLLDSEEFEGKVPKLGTLPAILRAAQIVRASDVSLGVTEEGNFSALWANEKRTIYVESLSVSHVRWAIAEESDCAMRTVSSDASPLSEFAAAIS